MNTVRALYPHVLAGGEKSAFFVFAKGLRAQRSGRVAPRRGGAKRRAAALGAAQRRKAPPQAAERRAAHKACFSAFNFAPIIEKQKMFDWQKCRDSASFMARATFGDQTARPAP